MSILPTRPEGKLTILSCLLAALLSYVNLHVIDFTPFIVSKEACAVLTSTGPTSLMRTGVVLLEAKYVCTPLSRSVVQAMMLTSFYNKTADWLINTLRWNLFIVTNNPVHSTSACNKQSTHSTFVITGHQNENTTTCIAVKPLEEL